MTNSRADKIQSRVTPADVDRTSTTTLADDATLKVTVKANRAYAFTLRLFIKVHATPDIKIDFTFPSGAVGVFIDTRAAIETVTSIVPSSYVCDDSLEIIQLTGTLITSSTPGIFQFQWAPNNSDANSCILKAGSSLMVMESL